MTVKARVYIVRHGETAENRQGIIQGQLDSSLNSLGFEQARLVGDALKLVPFDRAYSSDLKRAANTAEEILRYHPEVTLTQQKDLRERARICLTFSAKLISSLILQYFGDLQGLPVHTKLEAAAKGCGQSIEPGVLFSARAETWWLQSLLGDMATLPQREEPYNILVVSHGGFIGTLLRVLENSGRMICATPRMITRKCMNTSISIVEVEPNCKGTLVQYSDISHLKDLAESVVQSNADVELETK